MNQRALHFEPSARVTTLDVSRRAFLAALHAAASAGENLTELAVEVAATSSAATQLIELVRAGGLR